MKKKILAIFILAIITGGSAPAQTIKDNIDKAHNSRDAKDKSAKADVLIQPKTISDSVALKTAPVKSKAISTGVKIKSKSKNGKYKRKQKTS